LAKLKCPLFPDLAHCALNWEAVMEKAEIITMTMRALDRMKVIQALVDGNTECTSTPKTRRHHAHQKYFSGMEQKYFFVPLNHKSNFFKFLRSAEGKIKC
jgi:hypothetical protein